MFGSCNKLTALTRAKWMGLCEFKRFAGQELLATRNLAPCQRQPRDTYAASLIVILLLTEILSNCALIRWDRAYEQTFWHLRNNACLNKCFD